MSILIKGVYLPQNEAYLDLVITADGNVCCYDHEGVSVAKAVELPDHGDLIDRDVVADALDVMAVYGRLRDAFDMVMSCEAVIPAERSEEWMT